MTALLLWRSDRTYLVEAGDRLETDLGIIEVDDDVQPGDRVESHLGEAFTALRPRPTDLFDELDRSGAPMLPRDIGLVIGLGGLTAADRVLDVGTGTGILAITLGALGIDVVTVERDAEAADLAKRNVQRAGVEAAVSLRTGDALDLEFTEGFDALTLDTADAPALAERAPAVVNTGGTVVAYSPFVEDARAVAERLRDVTDEVTTFEPFHREMDFGERGSRPSTAPVGHTGYLTVGRMLPQPTRSR